MSYEGERAFPRTPLMASSTSPQLGMTLRDYFAAAYVQGRAAREDGIEDYAEAAQTAYELAAAMLKERAK